VSKAQLLAGLVRSLERIQELVALGRERYDADALVRLAVQRLWITAGNYADEYRKQAGLDPGVEPWAELYGYRSVLAHSLEEELSDERIWYETVDDLPGLLDQARATQTSEIEDGG
jgi:uncharacterized protein with HEPN domain